MIRAGVLFSGGLDSILAVLLLKRQGIDCILLHFDNYFEPKSKEDHKEIKRWAELLGAPYEIVDIFSDMIEIVKSPPHGYGDTLNPCIDCKILMLKKAKELFLDKGEIDFVATGEVVGQRPMTQNKSTMRMIEKRSGLDGYLLRPLSAKLLPETIPEKKGWVDREQLEGISGRGRKRQLELIEKVFGFSEYPQPAGGCLLTDQGFSYRMEKLMEYRKNISKIDVGLLKRGKFILENDKIKIVPRDEDERRWILNNVPSGRVDIDNNVAYIYKE